MTLWCNTDWLFAHPQGDGPLDAGIRLLPFIISMVVFAMLNGALMPKLPYILPWNLFGSAFVVVGTALMCQRAPSYSGI